MTSPTMRPLRHLHALVTAAVMAVVIAGCSSGEDADRADRPVEPAVATVDGAELFALRAIGDKAGCVTCHAIDTTQVIVGPSLVGIGDRAATRVDGLDGPAYIRESIIDPTAYTVDGFDVDKMPDTFGQLLSDEQIDALVTYLLELEP